MRSRAGNAGLIRDECMARNVDWILQQNPGARIVLWAHNGHICRGEFKMGDHLNAMFGSDYVPVGFTTCRGTFTARHAGGALGTHVWLEPPEESIESFLAVTGRAHLMLDLRRAEPDSPVSGWLTQKRPLRGVGAVAMDKQFAETVVADDYDLLVYIAETTPAVQLDTEPVKSR
jgi:erythromycin esterase